MLVSATTQTAATSDADTVALGLVDGAPLPGGAPAALGDLIESGEARSAFKALALMHAEGKRWLLVGLGKGEELTPERMRVAAATAHARALELASATLCWEIPESHASGASSHTRHLGLAGAIVEGTMLADYRFERFRSAAGEGRDDAPKHIERLLVSTAGAADADEIAAAVERAATVCREVNSARDLQNRPGNDLTPSALADRARELAGEIEGLTVEVGGRAELLAHGMGAFAAVAQGSAQEPALITLRYEPSGSQAGAGDAKAPPVLGLVGKAVTFDSGGISLKPGAKMAEMKFDMSGGSAVTAAIAAIARLGLPIRVIGVVGATENLPSGTAVKPGDIVRAANGRTIEVNNTDAEGRLVLADCLHHAVSLGAERVVDLATLTGAVIVALGSTYAGLMANDDELAERIAAAGDRSGEIVWRLPMHEEYGEHIRGRYADLDNAPEDRKAGTITAGTFLSNFVGEVPWAHLDIAGSAWDLGRAYAPKGAAGYGVRLLVELAS
ncbi:MAG: leucyl aminopeptidase, partial [Acidobacteriota bacterium]|nr:leucyl aminopeptidase [Acidobacteriota bacterium]